MYEYWLDANSLILPYRSAYTFTRVPKFWTFIEQEASKSVILSSYLVLKEIEDGCSGKEPDDLLIWARTQRDILFQAPNDDIQNAVEKMEKHKIKRLPVVENEKIVGIITNTDIARASPEMIDILNFRLKMRNQMPTIKESSTSGLCESCEEYSGDLKFENDQWVCENCRDIT